MKTKLLNAAVSVVGLAVGAGCWDHTPPPPRVPVPAPNAGMVKGSDPVRPLAQPVGQATAQEDPSAGLPYYDEPLVNQRPPEQQRFVEMYGQVGRPRIAVFVNRTLEGDVVPTAEGRSIWSMKSDTRNGTAPAHGSQTDVYMRPGTYDEVNARGLDYEAVESAMTDWIASNGQVVVVSPTLARQRLSDETIKEMQAGRPQVLSEVAQQLNSDILIQVAARPTRQTAQGLDVRLVAEAMNIKGGQSIGRAMVDVPPPLGKQQIDKYTRYLARKLMDDMSQTWQAPAPEGLRKPEAGTTSSSSLPSSSTTTTTTTTQTNENPPAAPQAPPVPVAPVAPPAPVAPEAPAVQVQPPVQSR